MKEKKIWSFLLHSEVQILLKNYSGGTKVKWAKLFWSRDPTEELFGDNEGKIILKSVKKLIEFPKKVSKIFEWGLKSFVFLSNFFFKQLFL